MAGQENADLLDIGWQGRMQILSIIRVCKLRPRCSVLSHDTGVKLCCQNLQSG